MTDNVTANPTSGGATFATDNNGGVEHWPITKQGWGTRDGAYNVVDMTHGLPVQPGTSAVFPVSVTGNATSDGSTTITAGGTAQNLFGGVVPTNGFSICNPDATNDLWISDSSTASPNGQGSIRIAANGGYYASEAGQKPIQAVSVYGAITGQKITARRW